MTKPDLTQPNQNNGSTPRLTLAPLSWYISPKATSLRSIKPIGSFLSTKQYCALLLTRSAKYTPFPNYHKILNKGQFQKLAKHQIPLSWKHKYKFSQHKIRWSPRYSYNGQVCASKQRKDAILNSNCPWSFFKKKCSLHPFFFHLVVQFECHLMHNLTL